MSLVVAEQEVFAIHDVCSHSAVSLSEGEVDGCTVMCWLHDSRFDLCTGEPLDRTTSLLSGPTLPATASVCWIRPHSWLPNGAPSR